MYFKILITLLTIYFTNTLSIINVTWVDYVINKIFQSSKLYQITLLINNGVESNNFDLIVKRTN